jgi:hypothetical protein
MKCSPRSTVSKEHLPMFPTISICSVFPTEVCNLHEGGQESLLQQLEQMSLLNKLLRNNYF